MIFGSILKYIRMLNNGIINKIGKSVFIVMFIILLDVKFLNVNLVFLCVDFIIYVILLVVFLIFVFFYGKYIKN